MTTETEFIAFCNKELQKRKEQQAQDQKAGDEQLLRDFYAKFGIFPEKAENGIVTIGKYTFKCKVEMHSLGIGTVYAWIMYKTCPRCHVINEAGSVRSASDIAIYLDVDFCDCHKLGPFVWRK